MIIGKFFSLVETWRWALLLSLLITVMFVEAIIGETIVANTIVLSLYLMVFAGTLRAATIGPSLRYAGTLLILVWYLIGLINAVAKGTFDGPVYIVVTAFVLVGSLAITLSELATNRGVGLDPIVGAVFGYVLTAVAWSQLYVQIETGFSQSFSLPTDNNTESEFLYFSLVTLTTLGYGDIIPIKPVPRILAGMQAAFGTIYIAVFVGRIVGRLQD